MGVKEEYYNEVYAFLAATERRGTLTSKQIAFIRRHLLARPRLSLLDFCCGHGRHLAALADENHELWGIDSSEKLLSIAEQSVNSQTNLILADVRNYRFKKAFDVIICMESSFNFSDADASVVMRSLAEALATDGTLLIHAFNPVYARDALPLRTWIDLGHAFICESRRYDGDVLTILQERFLCRDGDRYLRSRSEISMIIRNQENLNLLAASAGLEPVAAYGSFDDEALDDTQPELICLFRHAHSKTVS